MTSPWQHATNMVSTCGKMANINSNNILNTRVPAHPPSPLSTDAVCLLFFVFFFKSAPHLGTCSATAMEQVVARSLHVKHLDILQSHPTFQENIFDKDGKNIDTCVAIAFLLWTQLSIFFWWIICFLDLELCHKSSSLPKNMRIGPEVQHLRGAGAQRSAPAMLVCFNNVGPQMLKERKRKTSIPWFKSHELAKINNGIQMLPPNSYCILEI